MCWLYFPTIRLAPLSRLKVNAVIIFNLKTKTKHAPHTHHTTHTHNRVRRVFKGDDVRERAHRCPAQQPNTSTSGSTQFSVGVSTCNSRPRVSVCCCTCVNDQWHKRWQQQKADAKPKKKQTNYSAENWIHSTHWCSIWNEKWKS